MEYNEKYIFLNLGGAQLLSDCRYTCAHVNKQVLNILIMKNPPIISLTPQLKSSPSQVLRSEGWRQTFKRVLIEDTFNLFLRLVLIRLYLLKPLSHSTEDNGERRQIVSNLETCGQSTEKLSFDNNEDRKSPFRHLGILTTHASSSTIPHENEPH